MKFDVIAGKIASSLHNIVGIINKKSLIPGLSNVKIILNYEMLELITTDSEISISEILEVDGVETGQISINAIMLYDAVRKIRADSNVSFTIINGRLSITNGITKFLIPFVTDNCFPNINEEDKKYSIIVPICDAVNFFDKTKCAIALENTRINLMGIFFHTQNGMLSAAATDCNRLAYSTSHTFLEENLEIIIPRKTIIELNKLVTKLKPKDLLITFHGHEQITRIIFHFTKIKIITKLIVGQFPNYQKVIPINNKICLTLDTKNMIEIIERITIIASERNRAIKFNILNNQLKIFMNSSDGSFAEETIILEDLNQGEELEIAINYNYLLESLYPIDGKTITIKITDNKSAVLIEDKTNKNIGYVIMPMIG